jgi:hypothetical protein
VQLVSWLQVGTTSGHTGRGGHEFEKLYINEKMCTGLIDNQASTSMMTISFVNRNNIQLEPDTTSFLMADGTVEQCLGWATV